jgi:prepilin-type N-terminal cleavage/methylation domain-containing protein
MKTTRNMKAFTLVELLIAMVVTGIILSAVTTLAFAMSSASRSSDDILVQEAQLRQARLRITELVRTCKLICAAPGNDLVLWQTDANNDGTINVSELVYIERGDGLNTLRLCQFSPGQNDVIALPILAVATMKAFLVSKYSEFYVRLIPICQNVQFRLDTAPPFTRQLTISFGLGASGAAHPYEINVTLRAWAGHLLNSDGTILVSDDD